MFSGRLIVAFFVVMFLQVRVQSQSTNTININNISGSYGFGAMYQPKYPSNRGSYEFPKESKKSAAGVSSLWIGGVDSQGSIRMAAKIYKNNGDFLTGPLDTVTMVPYSGNKNPFEMATPVKTTEVNQFIKDYNNYITDDASYTFNNNLLMWAANPPPGLKVTKALAPFADIDQNGQYNPLEGDYPAIKGDQMMYLVSNDQKVHLETNTSPIGAEIHHQIYAYNCSDLIVKYPFLANTVFHHYKIYNRSTRDLLKTVIGLCSASCVGDPDDDYVGSNPNLGYAYSYNGDNEDTDHGLLLPATAIAVLKAPKADPGDQTDNNGNGIVDEINEEMSVPNVFYYKQSHFDDTLRRHPVSEPNESVGIHFYNYLTGFWKDGSPFTMGGDGYGGTEPTRHVFPESAVVGAPNSQAWSEKSAGNKPGQRSLLVCTQPFTFKAGSTVEIAFAFISAIDSTRPGDNLAAALTFKETVPKVKAFFTSQNQKSPCFDQGTGIRFREPTKELVYPNPTTDKITISSGDQVLSYAITDASGHFISCGTNINKKSFDIDFSAFSNGFYILELTTVAKTMYCKIIYK